MKGYEWIYLVLFYKNDIYLSMSIHTQNTHINGHTHKNTLAPKYKWTNARTHAHKTWIYTQHTHGLLHNLKHTHRHTRKNTHKKIHRYIRGSTCIHVLTHKMRICEHAYTCMHKGTWQPCVHLVYLETSMTHQKTFYVPRSMGFFKVKIVIFIFFSIDIYRYIYISGGWQAATPASQTHVINPSNLFRSILTKYDLTIPQS